jgi:tape measure domain-containing protein
LYGKIARNAKELSLTQNDILGLTEDINKALIIGGGSTQENQSAVLQLGQALASGRLQGDEFRSLMENAPRLTNAIAEGMGVGIGQLRSMSKAGELTAKVVIDAIRSQSAKLEKEFMQMPTTIGQAITGVGLRVGKFLQDLEKETGVFKSIAQGIADFFGALDDGIRAASTRVGGFKNILKIATIAVLAFGAAWVIVKEGLFTLQLWSIALQILRMNIIAVARSFLAFLLNPAFLMTAAIAIGIIAIALALEDVYYWVTGGESVIGRYAGSWEEVKTSVIAKINSMEDAFFNGLNGMLTRFAQWSSDFLNMFAQWAVNMIAGFIGFFSNIGQMWDNMKNYAISAFDGIITRAKDLFSFLIPIMKMVGKITGVNFGVNMNTSANLGMAGAGARNGNVVLNQTNQLLSGTPAAQVNFVQAATQQAADSMFRATLHTEYAI